MNIRTKLYLFFGGLFLLVVATAGVVAATSFNIWNQFVHFNDVHLRLSSLANDIRYYDASLTDAVRAYLISPADRASYDRYFRDGAALAAVLQEAQRLATTPDDRQLFQDIDRINAQLVQIEEALLANPTLDTAISRFESDYGALKQQYADRVNQFFQRQQSALAAATGAIDTQINQALTVGLVLMVALLVVSVSAATALSRSILNPLLALVHATEQISAGNWNAPLPGVGRDEIGLLTRSFGTMTQHVRSLIQTLEQRSQQLEARTNDLATTIEVGRLATTIYSQDELLPQLVEFIRARFGLDYTQIYLLDEAGRYAILSAGTGEIGQQLLRRQHRLNLAETSLVARAVQSGQTVLVTDTTTSTIHKANDLLPDTRSEVTIPLVAAGTIIGVLDMQSNQVGAFNADNVPVFEAMASQIAAVLHGSQVYDAAQIAGFEAEALNQRLTAETWQSYLGELAEGRRVGYEYDLEMPRALYDDPTAKPAASDLVQPVLLRGQPIGRVVVQDDAERVWQPEERLLIADIASRVAQALEQLRAFDQVKQAEAEVRRNEQLIRTVIDSTPDWIMVKDRHYRYLLVNQSYASALGMTPEMMVGKDDLELGFPAELVLGNPDKGIRGFRTDDTTVLTTGQTIHNPNDPATFADGSLHIFDTHKVPLYDHDGNVIAVLAFARDITERRQQEEATRQAREEAEILYRVSAAINEASDLQQIVEALGRLIAPEETLSVTLSAFPTGDYKTSKTVKVLANWMRSGGTMAGLELPIDSFGQNGATNPYSINRMSDVATDPRLDDDTRQTYLALGIGASISAPLLIDKRLAGTISLQTSVPYDFTERHERIFRAIAEQTAAALERQQLIQETQKRASELETVARVSAAATTLLNMDDLLLSVCDLTRQSFDLYHVHIYLLDASGANLALAAGSGEAGRLMKQEGRSIALSHPNSLVARAARERRGVIANDVTKAPDFLPHPMLPLTQSEMAVPMVVAGELIGVLDVQASVTNRFTDEDVRIKTTLADQIAIAIQNARAYQVQQETAERLREVDRLKSQFLANMSHELRTPLNSIIGYAEVLLDGIDGDLSDEAIEDVQAIHGGGKHLLSIINDILDLAKIDAGQMVMDRRETSLTQIIEEVVRTCQILVKDKGITLTFDQPDSFPMVYGDPVRLRQIVYNLVNNAIKFTEQGGVTISLGLLDNQEVCVSVTDTGIGMTEADLSVIFERFRQVDGSATRRAGGTGLGLAITRQLVQMHEGEIHVTSEKGKGSTFWFSLPIFQPQVTSS